MAHSYVSSLYHVVFSTKNRLNLITPELQTRLYPYLGGIARENRFIMLNVGGIANHVHLLMSLPGKMDVAKAVQLVKGGSSKWVHEQFPEHRQFGWQEGYGAFTIGVSQVEDTERYILKQEEHHRVRTFEEEYLAFLDKHRIAYDLKDVFD